MNTSQTHHAQDLWVLCTVVGGALGFAAGLLLAMIHRAFEIERAPALMIQGSVQYLYWIYGGLLLGALAGLFVAWRWQR